MCDLWGKNKQPFPEVRDKDFLPSIVRSVNRKDPSLRLHFFSGLRDVGEWLQANTDAPAHVVGIVNAGNAVHQVTVSLYKEASKPGLFPQASVIVLDSIDWCSNWHWRPTCTRILPAPGYRAACDITDLIARNPQVRGVFIPMNVQQSPMNCAIHCIYLARQIAANRDLFLEFHKNMRSGKAVHPFACEASVPPPYAREVCGLEEEVRTEAADVLQAYGSAYQRGSGVWEPLPDTGVGSVKIGNGILFQDLGAGARALHLKSIITALGSEADVTTKKAMKFTAKNGSLQEIQWVRPAEKRLKISVSGKFRPMADWADAQLKKNA
jgi:hypothetical protein